MILALLVSLALAGEPDDPVSEAAASVSIASLAGPDPLGKPDWLEIPGEEARLPYWTEGPADGRPIVVLHGGPGSCHRAVEELVPMLVGMGRRVIVYDQRGGGLAWRVRRPGQSHPDVLAEWRSWPEGTPIPPAWTSETWQDHVADLERLRRWLGVEQLDVVGHSWGGMLASAWAMLHPEHVGTLVLLGSGPLTHGVRTWLGPVDAENRQMVRILDPHGQVSSFWGGKPMGEGLSLAADVEIGPVPARCVPHLGVDPRYYHRWRADLAGHAVACGCDYSSRARSTLPEDYDLTPGLCARPERTVLIYGASDFTLPAAPDPGDLPVVVLPDCGHRPHVECPIDLARVLTPLLARDDPEAWADLRARWGAHSEATSRP